MKKILYFIIGYFAIIKNTLAFGTTFQFGPFEISIGGLPSGGGGLSPVSVKDNIIPTDHVLVNTGGGPLRGEGLLFSIFTYIRNGIFGLLAIITIGAFIFVGARLLMARGNPEEFKKALMHFIYIIIGLAIIALSWVMVTMVSNLSW